MVADNTLFFGAFSLYFFAAGFYIIALIWRNRALLITGRLLAFIGLIANTLALIARTMAAGHLPFASMYEFGMVMVWCIVVFGQVCEWRLRTPVLGVFMLATAFLLAGAFLSFYQEAKPLIPALKSNWLLAHVVTAVIAYGALTLSFAMAVLYFWYRHFGESAEKTRMMNQIASWVDKTILLAMPFLTLLIVTGAVWAEYAWGSYWRWDPKETWSLITWLIYSIYLHGRILKNWTINRAMVVAVVGFLAVLFTFIGVNVLLPGLHSYA